MSEGPSVVLQLVLKVLSSFIARCHDSWFLFPTRPGRHKLFGGPRIVLQLFLNKSLNRLRRVLLSVFNAMTPGFYL